MKSRKFIYLLLLAAFSTNAWAQLDSTKSKITDDLFVSAQYGKGFLLAHRGSLESLTKNYTSSLTIEVGKSTFGKKPWQKLYNYPSLGIGYYRGSLGNKDIFGNTNALYGFISSPYFKESKLSFNFKFGFGLAYVSKKFDITDNIYNVAIGSHVNYYVDFSFDLKLNLLENRLFIKTGPSLTHMSNGKTQTPNLGLNLISWHITSGYFIGKRNQRISKPLPKKGKHIFMAIAAGGFKEFTEPSRGKYFAGNVTFEYEYSTGKKCNWGLGTDYFYDGVVHTELTQEEDPKAGYHAGRFGIHASYSINYNKVGFIVQMGSYIKPYYTDDGSIYHRVGFRTKVTKHLLANVTMKTHWGKADIVEFGLGYYFVK